MKNSSSKKNKKDIHQKITSLFIEALESEVIPWRKPFKLKDNDMGIQPGYFQHVNAYSGTAYRGINTLILEITRQKNRYQSSYWLTFNQARKLGLQVRKGARATSIYYRESLYFKCLANGKKEKVSATDYRKLRKEGVETAYIPLFKTYYVFNRDQIRGESEVPRSSTISESSLPGIPACEQWITNYTQMPTIHHGEPCYIPVLDIIHMPDRCEFIDTESYYATLFHELIHSTGHASRLNRDGIADSDVRDKVKYSKEELVAEIGSSFLCAVSGILPLTVDNSKAYVQSWISTLKSDKRMIYYAASQAQRAVDFIAEHSEAVKEKISAK